MSRSKTWMDILLLSVTKCSSVLWRLIKNSEGCFRLKAPLPLSTPLAFATHAHIFFPPLNLPLLPFLHFPLYCPSLPVSLLSSSRSYNPNSYTRNVWREFAKHFIKELQTLYIIDSVQCARFAEYRLLQFRRHQVAYMTNFRPWAIFNAQ